MFVYLDETEFGSGKYSGYASLIASERVGDEVIKDALLNLYKDSDRFKVPHNVQDERTLDRGYFHAADDSKNAHSHFCNAINKHVVGKFKSHIFTVRKHAFSDSNELYNLASKLSVAGLFSVSPEMSFIFEERNGLSAQQLSTVWWPELWEGVVLNTYMMPFVEKYYPDVSFVVSGKKEPGLQVVDFLLWTSTRNRLNLKCKWFDRIDAWAKSTIMEKGDSWGGHSLSLKHMDLKRNQRYDIGDFIIDDPHLNSINILADFLVNAQHVVNLGFSLCGNSYTAHFFKEIEYLYIGRAIRHDVDFIIKLAHCFIKLFDNVGVIKKETPVPDKNFWLSARRCMAFCLLDGVESQMHAMRLSNMRNQLIEESPELLNIGAPGHLEL